MFRDIIESSINNQFNQENFDNIDAMPPAVKKHPLAALLTLIIVWLIILLVGKYLWNNCIVTLAPNTVKAADSIWQILGLTIFLQLIKS